MTIRVLHIFTPSLRTRFSGDAVSWKQCFENWSDPEIAHLVLNVTSNQIDLAKAAFDFDYPKTQTNTGSWARFIWAFQLLRALRRHVNEFDIIHFHVLWWGSLISAKWAKHRNIPTIYESVLLDADTPGSILHERWGRLKLSLLRSFSRIIAISPFLQQDYLSHGFPKHKVHLLLKSVDLNRFRPIVGHSERELLREKLNIPANTYSLLFVGSVIHRKGFDILIRAYERVRQRFPQTLLCVIGPCSTTQNPSLDPDFIAEQEQFMKRVGLANNIRFEGLVENRDRIADFYRASDVFIFPSRMEGLPNVVLEAMASGLPIVVSDLPVLEEIITSGENGIKVPIGDATATADAVSALFEDEGKRIRLGTAARVDALKRFSFQTWQDSLSLVYRQILADKKI